MTKKVGHENSFVDFYIVRHPIFDKNKNIWGYRLMFHACDETGCRLIHDPHAIASKVLVDGVPLANQNIPAESVVCFEANLLEGHDLMNEIITPSRTVLEFDCGQLGSQEIKTMRSLRAYGYRIALYNYHGELDHDFLNQAEIIKIDFSCGDSKHIIMLRSSLRKNHTLLADNLADWEEFEGAKALGFSLFQGPFFASSEILRGRKIPTHRSTRLRLVSALSDPAADPKTIIDIISADPPLAYRLLNFLNSSAFGFTTKISSLQRAVTMLGMRPLRNWAMLALISDMDLSDKGSELTWNSLQRAIFLKLVAEADNKDMNPDEMFLLGMLSNIEALIELPLEMVMNELTLSDALEEALLHQSGAFGNWLTLLHALDSEKLDSINRLLAQLGLSGYRAAKLYMRASSMASEALKENYCSLKK